MREHQAGPGPHGAVGRNASHHRQAGPHADKTKQAHVIGGQIEGRVALIFDDMISTGNPFCGAAMPIAAGAGRSIAAPTAC